MMSLNSRNSRSEIQKFTFPRASLSAQKSVINDIMVDDALGSAISFILTFGLLAWHLIENSLIKNGFLNKAEADTMPLFIAAMCLPISIWYFARFRRSFRIYRILNKISYNVEESISIHCSKISFIYRPLQQIYSLIVGIIITDENGNQFYYVYPQNNFPSESVKKQIKKTLADHDITLTCYKGTNIVKALSITTQS